MKSQVNALLHVAEGILTDILRAYPALEESLSKDMDRLRLNCQTRGLECFTLDLPALESSLLMALETGRLSVEGPMSKLVSKTTRVPRFLSGLWLRVFDDSANLRHEVDVNALFFLRCLLTLGKRIEVVPTDDRIQAKVGEYHDIERSLRLPSFDWTADRLHLKRKPTPTFVGGRHSLGRNDHRDHCSRGVSLQEPETADVGDSVRIANEIRHLSSDLGSVHLVQALDHIRPLERDWTGLFHRELTETELQEQAEDSATLTKIQQVADVLFGSFEPFDADWFSTSLWMEGKGSGFRHGPGAVAERRQNWEKSKFTNWPHKLQGAFPHSLCGTTPYSGVVRPPNHEVAARLIAVPKTAKGPRLIAAEPASHQWCQQLLLRFLFVQCEAHLGEHFIDFKDQGKSGAMVLRASLDRELATVDLSDASDRLTCWTVERIVRKNPSLLHALHAARTRYIRDEISDVQSFLELRKFASQGTATTFPIMSLVMLCIALGVTFGKHEVVTMTSIMRRRSQVRVFGDDIILPSHGYVRLVRAMNLLQLKVNVAKSYVSGSFRESCGSDGYLGFEITPVAPKTLVVDSPASCQAVVDTSNNLFNKGLFYASHAASSLIPISVRKYLRVVGRNEAGSNGLTSFCGGDEHHLIKRWNRRLHREEVKVWTTYAVKDLKDRSGDIESLLDFFARAYTPRNPRIVSEYLDVRKTKARLLWEPAGSSAWPPSIR